MILMGRQSGIWTWLQVSTEDLSQNPVREEPNEAWEIKKTTKIYWHMILREIHEGARGRNSLKLEGTLRDFCHYPLTSFL